MLQIIGLLVLLFIIIGFVRWIKADKDNRVPVVILIGIVLSLTLFGLLNLDLFFGSIIFIIVFAIIFIMTFRMRNAPKMLMSRAEKSNDFDKKHKLYKMAAEKGYAEAQFKLAMMYYKGEGVERDHKEAFKYMNESAKQDYTEAQYNLAEIYNQGLGVRKNEKESLKWYSKAAEKGHAQAQEKLDEIY